MNQRDKDRRRRRELVRLGKRGDSIKVVLDRKAGYTIVYYRDGDGALRKRHFPLSADGQQEASAWAEEYWRTRDELRKRAADPPATTHETLWRLYSQSPAFLQGLRAATRVNYAQRWAKWQLFIRAESAVDATTLLDVDNFVTAAIAAGNAPNQVRMAINTARIVYRWGESRELVTKNVLNLYRWSQGADQEKALEPGEWSAEDTDKILREVSPQSGLTWRPHVAILLAGSHGQRANAIRHLRWEDLKNGSIVWPAKWQKTGRELVQPLTWDGVAALETARYWRDRSGYTGPWVLYAGGGRKKLGPALVGNARHYRRSRKPEDDTPVTYGGLWAALDKARRRAGVNAERFKAFHGFRKGSAGNVADETGDARAGMEWIGDRDMKQMPKYLKVRSERMERAADAVDRSGSNVSTKRPSAPENKRAHSVEARPNTNGDNRL